MDERPQFVVGDRERGIRGRLSLPPSTIHNNAHNPSLAGYTDVTEVGVVKEEEMSTQPHPLL